MPSPRGTEPGDLERARNTYLQSLNIFTEMGAPGNIKVLEEWLGKLFDFPTHTPKEIGNPVGYRLGFREQGTGIRATYAPYSKVRQSIYESVSS